MYERVDGGTFDSTDATTLVAIPVVQVVEACSPKYAKKATDLGSEYITALPCEITAYVDDTNKTILQISV